MVLVKKDKPRMHTFLNDFIKRDWPSWMQEGEQGFVPACNVKENEKEYDLEVYAPGYKKSDIKVETDNNTLHVSADMKEETEEEESSYTRREFRRSRFNRSWSIPENVNEQKITADYKDGVLHIHLPKQDTKVENHTKCININ